VIKPILTVPDPILKKICVKVQHVSTVQQVIEELTDTLRAWEDGVGLAAPQIGWQTRVFVLKEPSGKIQAYVNPLILRKSRDTAVEVEGCGSIPGKKLLIERPRAIVARWTTAQGANRAMQITDFQARAYLHELDHLNGILITDLTTPEDPATLGS
jgi:peptide deformylase